MLPHPAATEKLEMSSFEVFENEALGLAEEEEEDEKLAQNILPRMEAKATAKAKRENAIYLSRYESEPWVSVV